MNFGSFERKKSATQRSAFEQLQTPKGSNRNRLDEKRRERRLVGHKIGVLYQIRKARSAGESVRPIGVTQSTCHPLARGVRQREGDRVKRLKELERENGQLRKAVSDLTLEKLIREGAALGLLSRARRRRCVDHVMSKFPISERFACKVLAQHRSTHRKKPRGRAVEEASIADIIRLVSRYGCGRVDCQHYADSGELVQPFEWAKAICVDRAQAADLAATAGMSASRRDLGAAIADGMVHGITSTQISDVMYGGTRLHLRSHSARASLGTNLGSARGWSGSSDEESNRVERSALQNRQA